jgi:hypothetical protein
VAELEQAACSDFTQDHQVFAVVTGEQHTSNFAACLTKAGTPLVHDRLVVGDRQTLDANPGLFAPTSVELDRLSNLWVKALLAKGFLTKDSKVGVVRENGAEFTRAYGASLVPALQAAGLKVTQEVATVAPITDADTQKAVADMQAALPKLVSQGVDRMLFLENGGTLEYLFMQGAAAAKFTPKYGLTSHNGGTVLSTALPKPVADNQLAGSLLVGFNPTVDLLPTQWPKNEAAQACLQVMTGAGVKMPTPNAQSVALAYCEQFDLIARGLANAGDQVTVQSFIAGVEKLGTTFPSTMALGTKFGPGRHDGPEAFKYGEYKTSCQCYEYTGDVAP